ncbi:hypothetical protein MWH93_004701 [Salmonella enterica]|uniref:Uncharacterized protein n=2 Tax=Salmonella enterica TaxID=28901 RepID=A0A5H7DUI5_SALET|nr:hypothetical protein LFZ16_04485 [Salmonella enterica subsp. enterica serovar India str. SA20085604]EAB7295722.1 hypothetical protein [Salmonella enterica subsp. enterica serovar Panama]EAM2043350.1 hypothetical protein [Salmonella enterica]ECC3307371.1 hypothetical protein [Salmonella enterica subsp. enterica]EDM7409641.1 hypothetical protein [Salmonella enterica subsp. enterica serovar Sandiego]EDU8058900.1 hypothetical protein [Salmonella enterica subsp. enterica serovar Kiambu]EDV66394
MTTITKERIELFIKSPLENGLTRGEQMELARIALASLDADKQELKIAELINKFYERYPLASFNKDTDRAEALGYFLAGAELQCFGEFIKYEELFGDE